MRDTRSLLLTTTTTRSSLTADYVFGRTQNGACRPTERDWQRDIPFSPITDRNSCDDLPSPSYLQKDRDPMALFDRMDTDQSPLRLSNNLQRSLLSSLHQRRIRPGRQTAPSIRPSYLSRDEISNRDSRPRNIREEPKDSGSYQAHRFRRSLAVSRVLQAHRSSGRKIYVSNAQDVREDTG